jgi:glycosyltransferase involved in cell wall biosynthesis
LTSTQFDAPEYSIVVPVFRTGDGLLDLVARIRTVFDREMSTTWELILVDDRSPEPETWEMCRQLALDDPRVTAIRLQRNHGKPPAVLCGLAYARGQFIITMDDDLQHHPEDIPRLAAARRHDVVIGQFERRTAGPLASIGSRIKSLFDRLILNLPCRNSPFKLISAPVAKAMLRSVSPRPFIPALIAHTTDDIVPVAIPNHSSPRVRSRYTLRRRLSQFANLLIGNSSLVLRAVGTVGVFLSVAGLSYASAIVYRWFFVAPAVPGWASLATINLVFGGVGLIGLGVIGEYLHRILEVVNGAPVFTVREMVGAASETTEGPAYESPRAPDGASP